MNKIKALFSNKKIVAIFSVVLLLIVGISGFAYHNHSESQKRIAEELRLKEEKAKEEALAKKVDEAKKVLDTKLENEDKLSTEDKTKLEAVKKQLTEAIEKKDEQNIIKLQNEFKTALNTAKDSITKVIADEKEAEEKRLAEEKAKQEEDAKQQAEATTSNTTPRPTNNAPTTQPTRRTQASTGTVNNNSGTTTTQPTAPAPQPEKPKERKPIADWMKVGNSGKIFKTKKEANDWAISEVERMYKSNDKSEFEIKYGVEGGDIGGYWIESIQYNDGTIEYTVDFYKPKQ